jgi:hypothetical protein
MGAVVVAGVQMYQILPLALALAVKVTMAV